MMKVVVQVAPHVKRNNSSVTGWLEEIGLLFSDVACLSPNIQCTDFMT